MDKNTLPHILSLPKTASVLSLDTSTSIEKIQILLQLAEFDGLKIYFDSNITGYKDGGKLTQSYDPDGFKGMMEVDGEVIPVNSSDGDIRLISGYCEDNQITPLYISVSSFEQNGVVYNSVDQSGHLLYPSNHKESCFYVKRDELYEFIKERSNNKDRPNKFSNLQQQKSLSYEDITITFLSGDNIELKYGSVTKAFTLESLSLRNKTVKDRVKLNIAGDLLIRLSKGKRITAGDKIGKHKGKLKKLINEWFGLKGDPFDKIGDKSNIYEPKFKIKIEKNRADIRAKNKAAGLQTSLNQVESDGLEHQIYSASTPDFEVENDEAGKFLEDQDD